MNAKLDIWLTNNFPKLVAWYCKHKYGVRVVGRRVVTEDTPLVVYHCTEKYPPPTREELAEFIEANKNFFPPAISMRVQEGTKWLK